jgi:hypothetical protein
VSEKIEGRWRRVRMAEVWTGGRLRSGGKKTKLDT